MCEIKVFLIFYVNSVGVRYEQCFFVYFSSTIFQINIEIQRLLPWKKSSRQKMCWIKPFLSFKFGTRKTVQTCRIFVHTVLFPCHSYLTLWSWYLTTKASFIRWLSFMTFLGLWNFLKKCSLVFIFLLLQ